MSAELKNKHSILILLFLVSFSFISYGQSDPVPDTKCHTVAYNQQLQEQYPDDIPTRAVFELYMKTERAKLNASGANRTTDFTIPVIFHVIHNGEAEGATRNVSATYVDAQLEQLNIDFANLAGSSNPVAADTQIEFCAAVVDEDGNVLAEPGINRKHRNDYGLTAPSWNTGYINGTIKPASQWDPELYCNIWVLDVSGGVLGYAQFPDAGPNGNIPGMPTGSGGSANEDGVVILHSSVGSMAVPFGGGNSAYDNGRTLTHEIGHWLGLRHIWGDGGCGVDDHCSDTPESDASNYGCPNHTSCSSPDMVENYMDYTNDDCMDIFTADQRDRMQIIMGDTGNPSPRRAILNNSTVCSSSPMVNFSTTSNSLAEGTNCPNQTVEIEVTLTQSISDPVTVTFEEDAASTATSGVDFNLLTTSITFPANATGSEFIYVDITQDAAIESSESAIINIASATGADIGSGSTYTLVIGDDDIAPGSTVSFDYINENFNGTAAGWTMADGGSPGNTWYYTSNGSDNLDGTQFAFVDSDAAGNGSTSYEELFSPVVNTSGAITLTLDFDQYFRKYTIGYLESVNVDVYDGTTWQNVYSQSGTGGSIGGWGSPNHQTIDISAYANSAMQLRFTYDAEYDWYWALDNVVVNGDNIVSVVTDVNVSSGFMEVDFGPNETVHFIDQDNGTVMMSLVNQSSHDFGCTQVSVDNAGISSYTSGAAESHDITDKNFMVIPEFNNPSAPYDITLFYTLAEIDGWIADNTQGSSIADLVMVKAPSNVTTATSLEIAPTTAVAYENDYQFTASYSSGFSGFALGGPPLPLPVELMNFHVYSRTQQIDLQWRTASELDNRGFHILRGTSASDLQRIGFVSGAGDSELINNYTFEDKNVATGVTYYYQLEQEDFDGRTDFSDIKTGYLIEDDKYGFDLYPNPASELLTIQLNEAQSSEVQVMVYNVLGKLIMETNGEAGVDKLEINIASLPKGTYIVSMNNGSKSNTQYFVKR